MYVERPPPLCEVCVLLNEEWKSKFGNLEDSVHVSVKHTICEDEIRPSLFKAVQCGFSELELKSWILNRSSGQGSKVGYSRGVKTLDVLMRVISASAW